jgi:Transposase, Mutator family
MPVSSRKSSPSGSGGLSGVDDLVISLSAKGLTQGEISAYLAEVYGAEVSNQTITAITDRVMEGMAGWQSRLLDPGTAPSSPSMTSRCALTGTGDRTRCPRPTQRH